MRYWMVLSRFLNDGLELVDAVHGEVADAAFQVGPDRFDGVEVGGVGGQADDVQPVPGVDHLAYGGADVGVQIIPNDNDQAVLPAALQ